MQFNQGNTDPQVDHANAPRGGRGCADVERAEHKDLCAIRELHGLNVFQVTAAGFVKEVICIQGRPRRDSNGRLRQQWDGCRAEGAKSEGKVRQPVVHLSQV